MTTFAARFLALVFLLLVSCSLALAQPRHGIAMHGQPAHARGFTHFPYVNPDAPKGGTLTLAGTGSFDSLNPLIVRGQAAEGVREHVFESLMTRAFDEPFSLYGLLAETIDTPPDRSWVAFRLNPRARFSDGRKVTVDDVIFSWATLRDHGRPNHRYYYAKVARVERLGDNGVKFILTPQADREMPLILGLMPVLPKHYFKQRDFEQTTLEPPIGSGPYVIDKLEPGRRIAYRRNEEYWGRDLPVNRGRHNFDRIVYDYYRDTNSAFEAFKKGLYDVRIEDDPSRWKRAYDFPAAARGDVVRETFATGLPSGMEALVFNTRRDIFADIRIRKALNLVFDFEWLNANLYYGAYDRTQSYYDGSELSSHGRPASAEEKELLAPFLKDIPQSLLNGSYANPESNASGHNRANRRAAIDLFAQAGYRLGKGRMRNAETGEPFTFEILVVSREQERLSLSFARTLKRIGVSATVRRVDSAQFQRRRQTYEFDMMPFTWFASLSPGNEQSFYWGSTGRGTPGTRNYMGAADPAIDAMIAHLLAAREREDFVAAVRALDRVLLAGQYVIPLFHLPRQWVARWTAYRHPSTTSLYGYRLDTWWHAQNQ